MPNDFLKIEEIMKQAADRENALQQKIDADLSSRTIKYLNYDKQRYENKFMLRKLIEQWREECSAIPGVFDDPELVSIIDDALKYSLKDVTATHAFHMDITRNVNGDVSTKVKLKSNSESYLQDQYEAENKDFANILNKLQAYAERMEDEASNIPENADSEKIQRARQLISSNLLMYFEGQGNGNLGPASDDAILINDKGGSVVNAGMMMQDRRNEVLFPHDPSPNDIVQGSIGDCYLISSLSAIARMNPNAIKECMRDNGDGTVTVRFYQRLDPIDQGENAKNHAEFKPLYVTVKKEVPYQESAKNSLWVNMIERAYAVAGRNISTERPSYYLPPRPDNIEELYEKYKKMPKDERPTVFEEPWLFDTEGELDIKNSTYRTVGNGGYMTGVMGTILGPSHELNITMNKDIVASASTELVYYQLKQLVLKKSSPEDLERLENAMKNLSLSQKLENMVSVAALLHDDQRNFNLSDFQIQVGENGKIRSLPKSLLEEPLKGYARCLEQIIYTEKKSNKEKVFSMEQSLTLALNSIIVPKNSLLRDSLLQLKASIAEANSNTIAYHGTTYPQAYLDIYNSLQQKLENGSYVGAGTPQAPNTDFWSSLESKPKFGLDYQHAYSVLGVKEQVMHGQLCKFVVVRNPHGQNLAPKYDFKKQPPEPMQVDEGMKEGIFAVELRHFVEGFRLIHEANKVDEPVIQNTKNPLTKKAASQYFRIIRPLHIQWLELPQKDFTPAMKMAYLAVQDELLNSTNYIGSQIGKEMSEIPFKKLAESCQVFLNEAQKHFKNEPHISCDIVSNLAKAVDLMQHNVLNPKQEMLASLSGRVLYDDASTFDIMKAYQESELGNGSRYSLMEAEKLYKLADDADPLFLHSSAQFKTMKESIHQLVSMAKTAEKERTATNFKTYMDQLDKILLDCNNYLSYKESTREHDESGKIIAVSDREKLRIETAEKIKAYVTDKKLGVENEYNKMILAGLIYEETAYEPRTDIRERTKEIAQIYNSKEFKKILEERPVVSGEMDVKEYANKYRKEIGLPESEKYIQRQEQILGELMSKKKVNKEALKDTIAKLVYGHFMRDESTNKDALLRDETKFVNAIKETQAFNTLVNSKAKDGLPVFLDMKDGIRLVENCKNEVVNVIFAAKQGPVI